MFRSTAHVLGWLLVSVAAAVGAQDPVPALPKPRPTRPAVDEEAKKALATRLCEAIDAGDPDAVDRALADGADPDEGMGAGRDDTALRTPLIHAVLVARRDFVQRLVEKGARLEFGDDKEHTPLMYAAIVDDAATAELLLRLGARVDVTDESGQTATDHARKSKALAELLATAAQRHQALFEALGTDDVEAAKKLVEAGASPNANDGKTCLLAHAVRRDDLALVKDLLALGCRADLGLHDGFSHESPLALAAGSASLPVLEALLGAGKSNPEVLADALAAAAGVEHTDRKERVRALLAAGADPSVSTLLRIPALSAAAGHADLETMTLLLEGGADQSAVDFALIRAAGIDDAETAGRICRALLAIGADPKTDWLSTNALGNAAEAGNESLLALLLPLVGDESLSAAVAQVARAGKPKGLQWLCENGKGRIDFTYSPGLFDPPLIAAIGQDSMPCIEILIAAGAPVEQAPNFSHDTPLAEAVRGQKYAAIERLLAAGADPQRKWEAPLREPRSALDVAAELDDEKVLALLRRAIESRNADRDPLGRTLVQTGLTYEELPRFYLVRYTAKDSGRSHKVYVRKAVHEYSGLQLQEIYALGYDSETKPGPELLRKVFQRTYGIGGLVLEAPSEDQTHWRIRFRIDSPVDITPERLRAYLDLVQATGDQLEREIQPDQEDRL